MKRSCSLTLKRVVKSTDNDVWQIVRVSPPPPDDFLLDVMGCRFRNLTPSVDKTPINPIWETMQARPLPPEAVSIDAFDPVLFIYYKSKHNAYASGLSSNLEMVRSGLICSKCLLLFTLCCKLNMFIRRTEAEALQIEDRKIEDGKKSKTDVHKV